MRASGAAPACASEPGDELSPQFPQAAIGLGSNLGHSCAILRAAWQDLAAHPDIEPLVLSSPYRSEPVGMESSRWFVNAAALVRTRLSPHQLLSVLQTIEAGHGRSRQVQTIGYRDRTLDLDLLLYDNLVVETPHLRLPHPRMVQRLFVLAPLAEIAADRMHPLMTRSIGALLADFEKSPEKQRIEKTSWSCGVLGADRST